MVYLTFEIHKYFVLTVKEIAILYQIKESYTVYSTLFSSQNLTK